MIVDCILWISTKFILDKHSKSACLRMKTSQDITHLSTHSPSCSLTHSSLTPSPISVAYWYRKSTSVIESSIYICIHFIASLNRLINIFWRAIRFVVLHYWSIHILFEIRVLSGSHLMKLAVGNIRELLTHLKSEVMMGKYRKICTSLHPENTDFIEIPWRALIFPYTCILCQNVEMNFNVSFTCYNFLGV